MKARFEFCWRGLWFGFYWKHKHDGLHMKFAFVPLFPLHVWFPNDKSKKLNLLVKKGIITQREARRMLGDFPPVIWTAQQKWPPPVKHR